MFCAFTSALPAVCVQCPIWLFFCSSLISRFPGVLLRYCVGYFAMVPVGPVITGITCAVTCHMCWISIVKSLCFRIISASFLITFLPQGNASQLTCITNFCYNGIIIIIIIIIIIRYVCFCHMPFLPGASLEPALIPTAHTSSFTLQHFPYYEWCSKYSCLL